MTKTCTSAQVVAEGLLTMVMGKFMGGLVPKRNEDFPTSTQHLLWMLKQIVDGNLSSDTKSHRWLGYVQGVLVSRSLLSVSEERDRTRDIFNGE